MSRCWAPRPGWLRYRLPQRAIRRHDRLVCIGQKQVWFLLRLTGQECDLRLDLTEKPEFDHWRWVDFWYPVEHVVTFKRGVYDSALRHLAPFARQVAGAQAVPTPARTRGRDRRQPQPPAAARARPHRRGRTGRDPIRLLIDNHSHSWRNDPQPIRRCRVPTAACTSASAMGSPITTSATPPKPAAASVAELTMRTGAGANCGSCLDMAGELLRSRPRGAATCRSPVLQAA